ncbi:hypothetical protein PBY51_013828 [Eleginops maclovinus]|uniref:Uncharacterized protein n=1 Tax=Eleginops maclovinus TaxID=56733 RepID=A0AAN7Y6W1_ELEMC|nr:hypothetical protein PBY51_013828 [Eleginops maclovinus]
MNRRDLMRSRSVQQGGLQLEGRGSAAGGTGVCSWRDGGLQLEGRGSAARRTGVCSWRDGGLQLETNLCSEHRDAAEVRNV